VAWRESVAVLKRFEGLHRASRQAEWMVKFIGDLAANFDGYCCSTCPRIVEVHGFLADYNALDLGVGDATQNDTSIFLFVVSMCERAVGKINAWVKEYGGFPRKEWLLKFMADTALAAKRVHVAHCIRQCTRAANYMQHRGIYVEALRRFPLALAEAKAACACVGSLLPLSHSHAPHCRGCRYAHQKNFERRPWDAVEEKWTPPVGEAAADPDEKPEWYQHEFIPIQPGTSSSFDKKHDMTTSGPEVWTDARRALVGKIVFSAQALDDSGECVERGGGGWRS
jgi:hypothetical protein